LWVLLLCPSTTHVPSSTAENWTRPQHPAPIELWVDYSMSHWACFLFCLPPFFFPLCDLDWISAWVTSTCFGSILVCQHGHRTGLVTKLIGDCSAFFGAHGTDFQSLRHVTSQ
jgi:hypothetical protein